MLAVVASFRDPEIAEASYMPCFRNIIAGAAVGAGAAGYAITVGWASVDGRVETQLSYDGVILVDPMPSDPVVERELAGGRPVLALGGYGSRPGLPLRTVRLDIRSGLPTLMDQWADRPTDQEIRPAIFVGPRLDHFTNDAIAAFQRWCSERGVLAQGGALEPGESLEAAAMRLVSAKVRPTLVHCMNESFSAAVVDAAKRIGVSVPGELRVSTVGNPHGLSAQTGVDYLATDPVQNGVMAARMMAEMLGDTPVEDAVLALPHHPALGLTLGECLRPDAGPLMLGAASNPS
ncbi:substrate-binding domain-containing protein [Pseudoclavibacter helvolus]|uniref:substrate-binding domain-containing protein n=2 Tax=Actinomycetes TaxID=1760 RepID=UPI003735F308